jgi:hypothetical protein
VQVEFLYGIFSAGPARGAECSGEGDADR